MGAKLSRAAKAPAPPLPPSSAQEEEEEVELTEVSSSTAPSKGAAAGTSTTARNSTARTDRKPNKPQSKLKLPENTKFSFPADLHDRVLSSRHFRIVKQLCEGGYGKVLLAWDERVQYAEFLFLRVTSYTCNDRLSQLLRALCSGNMWL